MIPKNNIDKKQTVYIVDDHPLVREGLALLISKQSMFNVVGSAGDTRKALSGIDKTKPDMAIIDISLKNDDGLELTKCIRKLHPKVKILILSMYNESIYAERALRAGARGYIMKKEDNAELLKAIRRVMDGEIYLNEKYTTVMLERVIGHEQNACSLIKDILTDRETEILRLIGQGRKNQEIAKDIGLSPKTVQVHKENMKRKLNLKNSSELVHYAINWGK